MLKKKKSVGNTREDIIFLKAIEHTQGMHVKKNLTDASFVIVKILYMVVKHDF